MLSNLGNNTEVTFNCLLAKTTVYLNNLSNRKTDRSGSLSQPQPEDRLRKPVVRTWQILLPGL